MRKAILALVAVLLVLLVVGLLVGDRDKRSDGVRAVLALGGSAKAAGCTPVEDERAVPPGPPHQPGTLNWAQVPPSSGVHNAETLRTFKRFYSRDDAPAPEWAVHDLEHGVVVAWYDPELPQAEVDALRAVADAMPIRRFVAVPWGRSTFAGGRHVVLTAWGHTQRCRRVSGRVAYDFTKAYVDKDAPEKGASV